MFYTGYIDKKKKIQPRLIANFTTGKADQTVHWKLLAWIHISFLSFYFSQREKEY